MTGVSLICDENVVTRVCAARAASAPARATATKRKADRIAGMRCVPALILGLFPVLGCAEPFIDVCNQQLPPAQVQVGTSVAEPRISFSLSAKEIRPLSGTALPGVSLGLTRVDKRVEQQIAFFTLRQELDGRVCARPRIDITLALRNVDMYVARELSGDDCLVGAEWRHELRHYAIWQETLAAAAAEVERLMQRHYDGAVLAGSEEEIRAQIESDLRGRWAREVEALIARANVEHELLDGRDALSYGEWCDGALKRLHGRFTRTPEQE
jgi:hypothetical protein